MTITGLGKLYGDGEVVVRQGETGKCMFVIQKGAVEVVRENGEAEIRVMLLKEGDIFGEMAIFEQEVRSATVRSVGEARILTVDKRTFLRRAQEDPTLVFNVLRMLCQRIRRMDSEIVELRRKLHQAGEAGAAGNAATANEPGPHGQKVE